MCQMANARRRRYKAVISEKLTTFLVAQQYYKWYRVATNVSAILQSQNSMKVKVIYKV